MKEAQRKTSGQSKEKLKPVPGKFEKEYTNGKNPYLRLHSLLILNPKQNSKQLIPSFNCSQQHNFQTEF